MTDSLSIIGLGLMGRPMAQHRYSPGAKVTT
jgi:3-hydroxyisobutyrate dehydrogenase-like beta-hydroxyacid dehydrogenase